MTTTTLPTGPDARPTRPATSARVVDRVPGPDHEALRTVVPTVLAVVLLVGLLGAGVLVLQRVLDVGVWLLAAG